MFKRIDQSNALTRLIRGLSTWLARNRGLPILAGIVLIVLATLARLTGLATEEPIWEVVHILLQNGGILLALVGILLLEPLGK
ncbi:hypothetical protein G4Y79_15985 [Phototrophicus methaneseepsis]|uniref:Uncharacterized protein n=1 Tax=Phototrophicus methaneseepsis TaxID=2710758 RepID=A0A7S8E6E0_9CHLR|nr:hypothetical protein [Phototrophicus methaneseepsis]QPC81202.1 hypothetical protein G4Y79_15985 [Phototrophicus methaneseepsis]